MNLERKKACACALALFAFAPLVASTAGYGENASSVVAAPAVSEFSVDDVELVFGEVLPKGQVPVFYNDGFVGVVYRPTRSNSLERPPRTVPVLDSDGVVLCYVERPEGESAIKCPAGKLPLLTTKGVVKRFAPRPTKNGPIACPPETGVVADTDGEILCYVAIPDVPAEPAAIAKRSAELVPVFFSAKDGGKGFAPLTEIYRPLRPATNGEAVERPARTVPVLDSDGYVLCYAYSPEGGDAIECPAGKIPVIDEKGAVDGFAPRPADKKPESGDVIVLDATEDGKQIRRNADGVALCLVALSEPVIAPIVTNASGEPLAPAGMDVYCFENGQIDYAVPYPRLAGGKAIVRLEEQTVPVLDSAGEILCWVCDSGNKAIQAPSGQVPVVDAKGAVERFISKDAEAPSGTRVERDADGEVRFFIYEGDGEHIPVAVEAAPAPAAPAKPVVVKFHKTSKPIGDVDADVWRNSIGMEFRLIPAGKFKMGSPETEVAREHWGSDETQREVTISRDFYMSVYETRQSDFAAFYWDAPEKPSFFYNPSAYLGSERPVDSVEWIVAMNFAATLNKYLGKELAERFGEGARYDLPTEAQWEYACRAGSETAFSFGPSLNGVEANVSGDRPYGTNRPGPTLGETTNVGKYKPNAWGLYDMHGNVWEWCLDWYAPYDVKDAVDPGNLVGRGVNRVLRGGAWRYDAWSARAANRVNDSDLVFGTAGDSVGFRLIIVPGDAKPLVEKYGDAQAEEISKRQREAFETSRSASSSTWKTE